MNARLLLEYTKKGEEVNPPARRPTTTSSSPSPSPAHPRPTSPRTMRSFFALRQAVHQATTAASTHIPRTKTALPIVGLAVHQAPLPSLLHTYQSTLALLQQFPPSAVYRQSVESITNDRVAIINSLGGKGSEDEIEAVEHKIGAGYIEEVLVMAEEEFALTGKMLEWKA